MLRLGCRVHVRLSGCMCVAVCLDCYTPRRLSTSRAAPKQVVSCVSKDVRWPRHQIRTHKKSYAGTKCLAACLPVLLPVTWKAVCMSERPLYLSSVWMLGRGLVVCMYEFLWEDLACGKQPRSLQDALTRSMTTPSKLLLGEYAAPNG